MIQFDCTCERGSHRAPLEGYEISRGALEKLPALLKNYHRIFVVADKNTDAAAGKRVCEILAGAGMLSHSYIVPGDVVLPDAQTVGAILMHVHNPDAKSDMFRYSPLPDFILAVGSGTINDSCRLVSYRLGLPYGVVGTAPSMDGYVSGGSPMLHDGTKSTIQCTTPKYFIADTEIAAQAPYDMLLAGVGDMFGKYTGLLDWELARDYTGEYFCKKIAADVLAATDKCLENGYRLAERDPDCIAAVMEGFLVTGLGMAYTGNSRPASGSEHIIAHAWELADVKAGNKPNLHGLEVCEATRLVAILYEMLYEESDDERLKALIARYLPYFARVEEFCKRMNVPAPVTSQEKIRDGIHAALTLRDRYTVLFYLRDRGLFESYAERASQKLVSIL